MAFHRPPQDLGATARKFLSRSFVISWLTAGALIVSVTSDAAVVALRLFAVTTVSAIPLALVGVEGVLAMILCRQLVSMTRLMAVARLPLRH